MRARSPGASSEGVKSTADSHFSRMFPSDDLRADWTTSGHESRWARRHGLADNRQG